MQLSVWNVQKLVRVIRVHVDVIDRVNAPEVRSRTLEAMDGARRVVLDLEEVATIDDRGLSALLALRASAEERRTQLMVCHLSAQMLLALQLLQLDASFVMMNDVDHALSSCGVVLLPPARSLEAVC